MFLASRRAVAVTSAVIALAGSAVPVLAQTRTASRPSSTTPVVKLQASNFFFCKYSATPCSSSNTNYKTKIKVGTKVKWFYKDSECDGISLCPGHNVKLGSHAASKDVKTENMLIYSMVFRSAGTFSYFCTHHKSTGMTGKIVVTRR
jgi:copper binding plastocyanin/azurin family protein